MRIDKALVWIRRGKNVPPTPWWKRPIEWLPTVRSSSSGSKLPDPRAVASKLPAPQVVASKLPDPQVVASKLPDPQAVASNKWARGAAAAGVTTVATVVVVRRWRQGAGEAPETSEASGDATDPSQTPGNVPDPSESTRAAEEGSGDSKPPDAQAGAEERAET
jgi:hypothetical protein